MKVRKAGGLIAAIVAAGVCLPGLLPKVSAQVTAEGPASICTFDARYLNRLNLGVQTNAMEIWDTMHCLAALQGIVNRDAPELYLFYCAEFGIETDEFWFDWFREEDGWFKGTEVRELRTFEEVLGEFKGRFKGLVVYDPAVPATANVASTAAGCDGLLPVRFDRRAGSVYERVRRVTGLPVKLWLVNEDGTSRFTGRGRVPDLDEESSGSTKIDAYRWALKRYLLPGRCGKGIAAYYIDAFWLQHPRRAGPAMHTLSNQDYFIAKRAFFFDLSPWGDEAPNDDPAQPLGLDRKLFLEILRAVYNSSSAGGPEELRAHGDAPPYQEEKRPVLMVGGFPPWPYKYTSHAKPPNKREGVPTEWEFGRLISQFNGYMEADAAGLGDMANASLYQHYPLDAKYLQPHSKPGLKEWRARGLVDRQGKVRPRLYLGHYVGDYDSPSWLYKAVPAFFPDKTRGKVPLGWAFNPNLADRAPQALVYSRRHATTNDFFIAGDSGAGYLNPRALTVRPDSRLPSGLAAWTRHCRRYYEQWDLSITGFILDGSGGASTGLEFAAYETFSPDGAGTHFEKGPAVHEGLATCPERDLPDRVEDAANVVAGAANQAGNEPGFLWARTILKRPEWYLKLAECLAQKHPEAKVEFVDPYTFFGLIKEHLRTSSRNPITSPEPSATPPQ